MSAVKSPRSLRSQTVTRPVRQHSEAIVAPSLACVAVGGGVAEAQTQPSTLPPMVVDAPVVKRRPVAAPKPSPSHVRARTVIRQRARTAPVAASAPAAPSHAPVPTFARLPSDNPHAQAGSLYKVNRVQSKKFTEPLLNAPRTIAVLSKEALDDKGATSPREHGRSTASVTLGSGEGGNAFGDRFFIRGFDARNDVFVDGIRNPAVSVRENFFTGQVKILRGRASSFAGRGTAGGAIDIVAKKATSDGNFRIMEGTGSSTDRGGRFTVDVNQVINSDLAVRVNGLYQNRKVPGRDFVTDDRADGAASVVYKPIEPLKISLDYIHVDLWGLPDFGVPYRRSTAGAQSAVVEKNEQLPPEGELSRRLGRRTVSALTRNPTFVSAAVPVQIFPPLFNRYDIGRKFGIHVDNAVRGDPLTGLRIRTDLSATLFPSEPEDDDGGDLIVEDCYGLHEVKLPAGDLVLYPSKSLHMVTEVSSGVRVAPCMWMQGMIRDDHARSIIFDLDSSIQARSGRLGRDDPETVRLTGVYHNLIGYWAET